MAKFNREICHECRVVFVKEKEDQKFCSYLCETKLKGENIPGARYKQFECQNCQRIFNTYTPKRWCSESCKRQITKKSKKTEHEKCQVQNSLWLENKQAHHNFKRNQGRKLSYKEMERRAEYKRVYGKGAWDHYEKGRKWNKI